ncbi:MAG: AMP-binding protein [Actinomycetota bacterium]
MQTANGGPRNVAARLEHHTDRAALILAAGEHEGEVSHADLAVRVARWRGGLAAAGVRQQHRVAVVAAPGAVLVTAHLAVVGSGAVSVVLNTDAPAAELRRELDAAAIDAVVADEAGAALVDEALALPSPAGTDRLASGDGRAATPQRIDPAALDGSEPAPVVDVADDDPAILLFTSGTAGPPRPAVLTHGNLGAALQSMLSLPTGLLDRPQVFLGVVPMFHVLGLNAVLHLALLLGATIVLGRFPGAAETVGLIERHRVTVALGPPNLWLALTRVPDVEPAKLASVDLALSGASELPAMVELAAADRLGIRLDEGYGLTETGAVVASTVATDAPTGSVGRLTPGVEARIVDEEGNDCLVGDPGELLVRGPMVFPGYWTPDGVDRGPLTDDGWLQTGDLAVVDDDGNLAIVGRRKDLIIVSGFNVFPAEVEAVLLDHPDVADAGVVGEPSVSTGEAVVAFVVPVGGRQIDEGELRDRCRTELARYKVPSRIVIAPDLPVGPTGKLQRGRLR